MLKRSLSIVVLSWTFHMNRPCTYTEPQLLASKTDCIQDEKHSKEFKDADEATKFKFNCPKEDDGQGFWCTGWQWKQK